MKNLVSIAALSVFAGLGCSSMVLPARIVALNVQKVDAPATVSATSPIDVILTVSRGACQTYDRIDAHRSASGIRLAAIGRDPERGCTDQAIIEPHTYRVTPPLTAGTFTITVDGGSLSVLTTTVTVQ